MVEVMSLGGFLGKKKQKHIYIYIYIYIYIEEGKSR